MPRKKPTSTRQKKEERQLKHAVKRGEISPPPPKRPQKTTRKVKRLEGDASAPSAASDSSRKLQSSFIQSSRQFLDETKALASSLSLPRPIPSEAAILAENWAEGADEPLSCPRKPKWRYDMSKKEVERNEEGVFRKWLSQTDELVGKWQLGSSSRDSKEDPPEAPQSTTPRSPTFFERNVEVWRQLWRVTEISQIILVLLDSRCPLLHYPPSLASYLSNHKVILVLTKIDISGPIRAAAWTRYFREQFPGIRVVQVESYQSKEAGYYHQGRAQYEPQIPQTFREQLVHAIQELHAEMLEPPEKVKANARWLSTWKPPVKKDIDWSTVLDAQSERAGHAVGGAVEPKADSEGDDEEPPFLTIGLIGQPNVGKSSLLNALFGASKVRASKTPGKTKHFQTLFWTSDVRLVDCPGLVMPNYVPMEMQVLLGILPIARVAAISACIRYACQFLPLEDIFKLAHPAAREPPVVDNRTWREGMKRPEAPVITWTAMDVLTAYAISKGWLTAKAGRPDVSRAGNAILRALAEGKVSWAFWPPGAAQSDIESVSDRLGCGVWIQRDLHDDDWSEGEDSDKETTTYVDDGGETEGDDSEDASDTSEISDEATMQVKATSGRFAALQFDDDGHEDSEDDCSDEDE